MTANLGDTVAVSANIAPPASVQLTGFVSAANQVKVRWCNFTGGAIDPDGLVGRADDLAKRDEIPIEGANLGDFAFLDPEALGDRHGPGLAVGVDSVGID